MKGSRKIPSAAPLPYPQTPDTAKAWFTRHGINKSAWARDLGIDRMVMVDLLRGRLKGLRGEAHRAAIALGLKANPESTSKAA